MKIRSKIFKRKSRNKNSRGDVDHRLGKWVLRIEYFDDAEGKTRTREKQFDRRSDAVDERPRLENGIRKTQGQITRGEKMTFGDLADLALKELYKHAEYDNDGYKRAGVRSHTTTQGFIENLRVRFGPRKIVDLTPADLHSYRDWRFKLGSRRGKKDGKKGAPITQATINRELATMRRIMKFAYAQGWVLRDIFAGSKVINTAREVHRDRRLSQAEEDLLLACCQGERTVSYERKKQGGGRSTISATIKADNPYLKSIILLAVDAGMRRGEILKLRWAEVDFDNGTVRILGTHTKTEQERLVPLSARAAAELRSLPSFKGTGFVYPQSKSNRPMEFKRSWETAKELAGIKDLRFHDLRRTCATRMLDAGESPAIVAKVLGHARFETTLRHYVSSDTEMVRDVANRLNRRQIGDEVISISASVS